MGQGPFGPGPVWALGQFVLTYLGQGPFGPRARFGPVLAWGPLAPEGPFFLGPDLGEGFPLNVAHIYLARGQIFWLFGRPDFFGRPDMSFFPGAIFAEGFPSNGESEFQAGPKGPGLGPKGPALGPGPGPGPGPLNREPFRGLRPFIFPFEGTK